MHLTHALDAPASEWTNEKITVDACVFCMYGAAMTVPSSRRKRAIGLAALRGFEASARRLSFTLAATELNLTQSSVSRQVAELERQIGKALFARRTRALVLTAAGQRLLRAAQQALNQIDRAVDEIRGPGSPTRVSLTTYASFASLWLVPRLAMFQRDHPEIEIRIDAADRVLDLETEDIDIAIRWTRSERLPKEALPLVDDEVMPALSPMLLERSKLTLAKPQDLFRLPLLEMDEGILPSVSSNWPLWFEFAGVRATPPAPRLLFSYIDQSIQAAVRGQGVVLARTPFVDDLVASGDLIAPFPKLKLRTGYSYALIMNHQTQDAPHVAAFRDWVRAEFKRGPLRQT